MTGRIGAGIGRLSTRFDDDRVARDVCMKILHISLFLKIYFSLFIAYNCTPHDLGMVSDWENITKGHLGYIQYLFQYRKLPMIYDGQFYHPPLFYIIGALVFAPFYLLSHSIIVAFEPIQTLNLICAYFISYIIYKMLRDFNIRGLRLVSLTAFIAFYPLLYIMGEALNGDCLMNLFCVLSLYCCFQWRKDKSYKHIIGCALFLALGMLTKTSAVLISPAIAVVFIAAFVNELRVKNNKIWKIIRQYIVFLCISVPVGMSWVVRQNLKFGLPFSFVWPLPEGSTLYIDMPFWQRIGFPPFIHFISYMYDPEMPEVYYNVWGMLLQSAVYDEGITNPEIFGMKAIAVILVCLLAVIMIVMIVDLIRMMINKEIALDLRLSLMVLFLTMIASYLAFCYRNPYTCTMHARYIFPVIIPLLIAYGTAKGKHGGKAELITALLIMTFAVLSGILFLFPYANI